MAHNPDDHDQEDSMDAYARRLCVAALEHGDDSAAMEELYKEVHGEVLRNGFRMEDLGAAIERFSPTLMKLNDLRYLGISIRWSEVLEHAFLEGPESSAFQDAWNALFEEEGKWLLPFIKGMLPGTYGLLIEQNPGAFEEGRRCALEEAKERYDALLAELGMNSIEGFQA